jgi:adenylate cyclase
MGALQSKTVPGGVPGWAFIIALLLLLIGLPLAVWLDLRDLAERSLKLQANSLNSVITSVRSYYATNVVARVLASPGATKVVHNYLDVPGAIPIPATLSLELGKVIGEQQGNISYRFASDYPFNGRQPHALDEFEQKALAALRADSQQKITQVSWSRLTGEVRLVAPVVMAATCVNCHNSHPDSPKRDWKVGDVRGIQEVIVQQPIAANLLSFKWLIGYFVAMAMAGFGFVSWQNRQARQIAGLNAELESNNAFLASISLKISRYLSPQLYKSIFAGEKDTIIHTERKKLTIFFADIKDFTATTEQLQPEEITVLLNEYFTAMSNIALAHGGTVDKFIGDAILIFFGDPETKGVTEDARACLRMAFEMQRRIAELNAKWRSEGHRTALPRPHGHQHRLLQRRQFRQRRSHGLYDHRRGGEPRSEAPVDRPARADRDELRNLRAGTRYGFGSCLVGNRDERHRPPGCSLCRRRHDQRQWSRTSPVQRACPWARFLPRPLDPERGGGRANPQGAAAGNCRLGCRQERARFVRLLPERR